MLMSETLLQDRQRLALHQLLELAQERARREEEHERGHRQRSAAAEKDYRGVTAEITARYEADKAEVVRDFQEAQQNITATFEKDHAGTDRDYRRTRHTL